MNFLDELAGLILNKIGAMKSLVSITKLESRLAGLSILPLIVCIILLLVTLTGIWLTTNLLLGYLVWLYCGQVIYSLISILIINILLLVFLKRRLLSNLRKMSFAKTRKYFDEVLTITEKNQNECKEENPNRNTEFRKNVTNSTKPSE